MTPKGNDHRIRIRTQNRGNGVRRAGLSIFYSFALAPSGDRFDIDTKTPAQRRVCSLRFSGYCCAIPCQPWDRTIEPWDQTPRVTTLLLRKIPPPEAKPNPPTNASELNATPPQKNPWQRGSVMAPKGA